LLNVSIQHNCSLLFPDVPLPVAGKVHTLAALHCQRRYAVHLIAIRDAAVTLWRVATRCECGLLSGDL
jgi:hypothetical protein